MFWNNCKDKLPEDCINDFPPNSIQTDFDGTEYIECLVHTNFGNTVTKRYHSVYIDTFEYEPNVLGNRIVDKGWHWFVEIGNSIRENPTYVDHWAVIPNIQ